MLDNPIFKWIDLAQKGQIYNYSGVFNEDSPKNFVNFVNSYGSERIGLYRVSKVFTGTIILFQMIRFYQKSLEINSLDPKLFHITIGLKKNDILLNGSFITNHFDSNDLFIKTKFVSDLFQSNPHKIKELYISMIKEEALPKDYPFTVDFIDYIDLFRKCNGKIFTNYQLISDIYSNFNILAVFEGRLL